MQREEIIMSQTKTSKRRPKETAAAEKVDLEESVSVVLSLLQVQLLVLSFP